MAPCSRTSRTSRCSRSSLSWCGARTAELRQRRLVARRDGRCEIDLGIDLADGFPEIEIAHQQDIVLCFRRPEIAAHRDRLARELAEPAGLVRSKREAAAIAAVLRSGE